MATAVAELKAVLGLDTGNYRRAKDGALAETKTFAASMQGSFARIGAAIGAGLGATALIQFGRRTLQLADDIETQSQAIGITTDQFEGFQFAARKAGESTQAMLEMVGRVQNIMGEAAQGNKRYQETLARIGIDMNGGLVPAIEALGRYIVATNGDASAMADIFDVLGTRSGLRLINTLKAIGNEGLQTVINKGKEAGQVMGNDLVKDLAEANHQIEMMTRSATIFFGQFLGGLKEVVTRRNLIADAFRWWFGSDNENEDALRAGAWAEARRARRANDEARRNRGQAGAAAGMQGQAVDQAKEEARAEDELTKALERQAKAREKLLSADELVAKRMRELEEAKEGLDRALEDRTSNSPFLRAKARLVDARTNLGEAERAREAERENERKAREEVSDRRAEIGMAILKNEAEIARLHGGGGFAGRYAGAVPDAAARIGGAVSAGSGTASAATQQVNRLREIAARIEETNQLLEEMARL